MRRTTIQLLVGAAAFLAGGAILALVQTVAGAAVGSTFGIAGIALMAWTWMTRDNS